MAKGKPRSDNGKKSAKRAIKQYQHSDKDRVNIPPVGLVTPETDPDPPPGEPARARKTYAYDPHLDPQLTWAGKAERTSFEVPTVSLHVHERIDPKTIIEAVRAVSRDPNGNASPNAPGAALGCASRLTQMPLFAQPAENPPLRDAVEFYKHRHNWSNRLVAGDSLLVMNSLLEKEGLGGAVQMIYIDPPYGIRYGSNFQPFVNKRDVKDGSDDDLTQEPEMLKAFRDTWELGIHSYLTYLRDRLLLAKDLLHESGSCFVQISDENLHHVRELMDEVFGPESFVGLITIRKTAGDTTKLLTTQADYILWHAKDRAKVKYRPLFLEKRLGLGAGDQYDRLESPNGKKRRRMTPEEYERPLLIESEWRAYRTADLRRKGFSATATIEIEFDGKTWFPGPNYQWKTNKDGLNKLIWSDRLEAVGNTLEYRRYFDDFAVTELTNIWMDAGGSGFAEKRVYVVQTITRVIERCVLMTTDPGDLVFDPTCGSGTTAYVAEQWGRRWITADTSRVAITLAKQRLMTGVFDYYTLAHPEQGVGSGFKYKTVPHVTLKSIANNPEIKEGMARVEIDRAIAKYADQETLYDQPEKDKSKARVTGPFTVEAVPAAAFGAPEVKPVSRDAERSAPEGEGDDEALGFASRLTVDASIAREGETLRQAQWRAELLKTGIRAKQGEKIEFVRVEALPVMRYLQAECETKPPTNQDKPKRVVVSFGPEFAPLEQRQVERAIEEARSLVPKVSMVVFAALQFDPEASKDIDETRWPGVTLIKVQMNGDLFTDDLKKKRSSNESFWLVGQPDVTVRRAPAGKALGSASRLTAVSRESKTSATTFVVEVHGFDYYNPKSGKVESGGQANIAMWMLDTDYDGRSVYARQVFFPMSGPKDGWSRLAKNLKAEIDEELIEQYRGSVSLPFEKGRHGRVAVKIVDDRGIESLRIIELESVDGEVRR